MTRVLPAVADLFAAGQFASIVGFVVAMTASSISNTYALVSRLPAGDAVALDPPELLPLSETLMAQVRAPSLLPSETDAVTWKPLPVPPTPTVPPVKSQLPPERGAAV